MDHQLISPNLHVILIHYPLGLLIAGTLIELFSFMWPRSSFRLGGRWMILVGALSAVPTTFSGIYALNSVAQSHNPVGMAPWVDVKAASPTLAQPVIWEMMRQHVLYQSIATGICVLVVVAWLALSDRARKSLHIPLMVVLLIGVAIVIRASYFGGEAVYRHGVAVESVRTGAEPVPTPTKEPRFAWEKKFPPLELHAISAGTAIALALVSIGLSFRKITSSYEVTDTRPIRPREETMAPNGGGTRTPPSPVSMVRSFNPEIEVTVNPFAPSARFWLLTALLALMTVGGGLFVSHADAFAPGHHLFREVWEEIKPQDRTVSRLLAHVTAGTIIFITPLVLAMLARFAPRRRFWLTLLTSILLVAVGLQIWFGVLLMFDTPAGKITRWNDSERTSATTAPAILIQ